MPPARRAHVDELPASLPVFALAGTILLPGGTMPLMMFEPRYLAVVDDALGAGRMFAMIQPRDDGAGVAPGLHDTGSVARITAFGEAGDGRYLVTVAGLCRFRVAAETPGRAGYRRVRVDYGPYLDDLGQDSGGPIDRRPLLGIVRTYLGGLGMAADLAQLEKADDSELVVRLAMACPFSTVEKQALLEASSHAERCLLMTALIQRELLTASAGASIH